MKYEVGDKIYGELYKEPLVVVAQLGETGEYLVKFEDGCFEDELMLVDDKKLELYSVGYLRVNGEGLKFAGIYNNFEAIFAESVGGSGQRVEIERTAYRLLNEEEVEIYKHEDFRQRFLDSYGVEWGDELYRIGDVVKYKKDGVILLGEVKGVKEETLKIKAVRGVERVSKKQVIHLYPRDKVLEMSGHNYYKAIER